MARQLEPLGGDWYEWNEATPNGTSVRIRVGEAPHGRIRIDGIEIEGSISAESLRSIPVGRIEAAANAELHQSAEPTRPRRPKARIPSSLRSNAVQGYPDAFYASVASTYRHLAGTSRRPVGELAEANEVPVTTAQRWVKEARRRGLLAPGHPGKAG